MAVDWDKLGNAAGSLFGALAQGDVAKGYKSQQAGYNRAAEISLINKEIAGQAAEIEMGQAERDIYRNLGAQVATTGASGIALEGSALDVLRDSAREGSITKQLLGRKSAIEQLAYDQEAQSYAMQAQAAGQSAKSAKKSKTAGLISTGIDIAASFIPGGSVVKGVVKGAGKVLKKIFSDDNLKEDINFLYRRGDGLGVYSFRYKGQPTVFKGVLASEVERLYPQAVSTDDDGDRMVDYDVIGVYPEIIHAPNP